MIFDATDETFERDVVERSRTLPVVVDFWAAWCGPCRQLTPVLEKAVTARGEAVALAKVDTDANPRVSSAFRIQSIPSVKAFKDGRVVSEFMGAQPPANVERFLDALLPSEADGLVASGSEKDLRRALTLEPGRADAAVPLARLLVERGADPYDMQVVYNTHFLGDVRWFLELAYERAVATGRASDWDDPAWPMFDMGGYGSGARFLLHGAVRRNDLALAGWMLEHGADPNAPPARDPRLPKHSLHQEALRRGLTEMAALLVRHGATPSGWVPEGAEAFAAACLRLDREAARALAERHPEYLREPGPLMVAAASDRVDVVALLLDLGMSPDVEDARHARQRPLHVAAFSGATRVAELLIARGATVDAREDAYGATPLGFAIWEQRHHMIELLGRHGRDVWNLGFTGNVARLRAVLAEEPALARTTTAAGETPLMRLPGDERRALEVVELLLAHGADPAQRTTSGLTAEAYARKRGLDVVADRLRAAGG